MLTRTGPILLLCSIAACAAVPRAPSDTADAWAAPDLDRAISVFGGQSLSRWSFDAMLAELAAAEVVFLGETHLDETTHRIELAIYEDLIERTGGRVTLVMEMFERDVQPVLDDYLAGRIDEVAFLHRSRPWGNYRTAYRPLIETARKHGLPVVASNTPVSLRRKIAMGGREAFDALEPAQKALLPRELFPNSADYWRRVDNAVRGHIQMMGPRDPESRLLSGQSLWDNTMGFSCAEALEKYPNNIVLHVNGGFHSSRWDGTVHQLRKRRPDAVVKTVDIATAANPGVIDPSGGKAIADFMVFAESRARDAQDGMFAVTVSRELRYRLHVPLGADSPVPLLIWLCDDGFTPDDGMELLRDLLGKHVAIAVLEPPYPAVQEDLQVGGRWFWPETFSKDLGLLETGIARIWGYLLRNQPIDPETIVLAGEGTGATVAVAATLWAGHMGAHTVAIRPRHFEKLRDVPLPLPEDDEPRDDEPAQRLTVVAGPDDAKWWRTESADYSKAGLPTRLVEAEDDPWLKSRQLESTLRVALGLKPLPPTESEARAHVVVDADSPRARHWARILALKLAATTGKLVAVLGDSEDSGSSEALDVAICAADFARGKALPLAPGPFGGTTVVVLPADITEQESAAWFALEKPNVLTKRSRFHRLRVATIAGENDLRNVLDRLRENSRKNVLIVPAVFCAAPDTMRELRDAARGHEEDMTLQWSAGLGARLHLVPGED